MIYFVLISLIILLYPVVKKFSVINIGRRKIKSKNAYCFIISTFMIIMIGCRAINIGIDTADYKEIFEQDSKSTIPELVNSGKMEIGYSILEIIVYNVFGNFHALLFIAAILYIVPVTIIINKYSKNICFSYLLFVTFGFFTFAMSTVRQAIAMGILMMAFIFIKERKMFKFIICVWLASLFHITSLVFLPAYWVSKLTVTKKTIFIISVIAIILIVFKSPLISIFNQYARMSYDGIITGGNNLYIFILTTIILGLIYKKFYENNETNKTLLFMLTLGILIFPVTQFNPAVMRLYFYFIIYMIIVIPNLLEIIMKNDIKYLGYFGYTVIAGYFMYSQVFVDRMQLLPYHFFWN